MNGHIVNIATQTPEFSFSQSGALRFMQDFHGREAVLERQLKVLYSRSKIDRRYSVLPDFTNNCQAPLLFGIERNPGLTERQNIFKEKAIQLATSAATQVMDGFCTPKEITNIIAVSCTGLFAPGLEFQLIQELSLSTSVERHSINFVGCYASVPALHLANLICHSNPKARILLVSVELCSLHLQKNTDRDTLTANAIFSDGCAACLIEGAKVVSRQDPSVVRSLELGRHFVKVYPKGETDMTWEPTELGFLIRLSSYIPLLISEEIREYVLRALEAEKLSLDQVRWAFHPGGAQIMAKIKEALKLTWEDVAVSENILRLHGNMSSATILYILKDIMGNSGDKEYVFASAFGPGLTFESIVLRHV